MRRTCVKDILNAEKPVPELVVKGWVRTKRDSKGFSFLEVNDGSCLKNVQIIIDHTPEVESELEKISTGASVSVVGELVESPGKGQKWEVRGKSVEMLGYADPETFPMQKKRHSDEFLRTIAHLRPRTNKFSAMFRIRSELSYAIHSFFRDKGFFYVHTPIITGSDCEGAGEMFRVTSLDYAGLAGKKEEQLADDFFGKAAHLTVSGQLPAEMYALSLGQVYTFGPTFRAEKSNTPRHAAEFWMVEPEVAFADLDDNMDLGEEMVKYLIKHVLERCADDIELFAKFVDKSLMDTLNNTLNNNFERISYTDAVELLRGCKKADKFEFRPEYGEDLQTEHERYLTEEHFGKPVIVYNYPREIKPFYMRVNDDGKTVTAMDLLVPRIGELVGGSQREERLDVLESRIAETGMDAAEYWWYLDSRRFGSAPHSGFGMGFERMLMLLTGATNIRDVIPFPRTPKNLEF
ncbi:asparagine--tRNA ligase [Maridesulfovibrio sp.]|uniref:asparagine--tRNA ligase n=1 Tax=Maridesulfovibrio sp. TaxID=2795000 RepID=UPI002A18996D|nr:asparagine--tRNA ligase [Maridesulfovibrio sp.]